MNTGRVLAIVFGSLAILIGLGIMAAAGGVLFVNALRDDGGYITTSTERLAGSGFAVVSEELQIDGPIPGDDLVDIRIRAESTDARGLFVGVARTDDVERYLRDVPVDVVRDVDFDNLDGPDLGVATTPRPGTRAPAPPVAQNFWEASAVGVGAQTLDWSLEAGDWTFVVMRPTGARGVEADVDLGVGFPSLLWIGVGILIVGGLFVIGGIVLLVLGIRGGGGGGDAASATDGGPAAAPPESPYPGPGAAAIVASPYPVNLEGEIDPGLSRWQWLVKWFLAIPHLVVLVFLGIAFSVLTVVAFFAIVFTGRYPRGIFDFNAGVLRWSWRVGFYAFTAIGTDRYPPFSLQDEPGYPARLEIAYPERLSRGLVWVKWWLLAIPHYVIVGIFVGGWYGGWGGEPPVYGAGLIGVLVAIAAVALLFTGRYLRSIFTLLIGLNRWVYRVWAYASLMRDEYPPFRLER